MLIFQPLVLKFLLGVYSSQKDFAITVSSTFFIPYRNKRKISGNRYRMSRQGGCLYVLAAQIAVCTQLPLHLSLFHGLHGVFPIRWINWRAVWNHTCFQKKKKKIAKGIPGWDSGHLPKLGCAEPESDEVKQRHGCCCPRFSGCSERWISLRNYVNLNFV